MQVHQPLQVLLKQLLLQMLLLLHLQLLQQLELCQQDFQLAHCSPLRLMDNQFTPP